jgi:phage gp29-like protein
MGLREILGMAPKRASYPSDGWLTLGTSDRDSTGLGQQFTKAHVNGYISTAAQGDTRSFSAFKREMVASDAHLSAEIDKAKSMLVQAPLEVTPWPPSVSTYSRRETPEAQRALEITAYCREQLLDPDVRISRAIEHALWGVLDGVAGFEVVWSRLPGGRYGIASIGPVPSDRFRWFYDRHALGVQPGTDSTQLVPVEDFGPGLAVIVAEPEQSRRDRAGLLRRCVSPWLTARNGRDWWARDIEIFASPFRWAKYKRGDKDAPAKLREALRTMGNLGYAAFPDDVDLEFVKGFDTAGKGQGDLVGYCERSMSKAILGATQTADVQVGAGSKASAGVHLEVIEIRVASYGKLICEDLLRRQILKPLVAASFGAEAAELYTPVPQIRLRKNDDLLEFMQAMKTAREAGVTTIPVGYVHARTGIPQPEEGEPTLQPPPAPEAPPAGAGREMEGDPEQHAARRPAPASDLARLEAWAVEGVEDAGKALLAPYVALIAEVKRDGGDLGHLAARVRLQAQMANEGKDRTADLVARVVAHALLTGWAREVGIEPPKAP